MGSLALAQVHAGYADSLEAFRKNYMATHEVVKGKDKKYFRFFPVSSEYAVECVFERIPDSTGFSMPTSAGTRKEFYKYGKLSFRLTGRALQLYVYQGKELLKKAEYRDYLFVPFTDSTSGDESYGGGRYLEFYIPEIRNNHITLDFNKAYNPYCAYASGFRCPVPPAENHLSVAIRAGEKAFGKKH
jgi:uncharacterized protein (DUF1684 family)